MQQDVDDAHEDNEDSSAEAPVYLDDVKECIKETFLLEMPDDFYQFWDFCKQCNRLDPRCEFSILISSAPIFKAHDAQTFFLFLFLNFVQKTCLSEICFFLIDLIVNLQLVLQLGCMQRCTLKHLKKAFKVGNYWQH